MGFLTGEAERTETAANVRVGRWESARAVIRMHKDRCAPILTGSGGDAVKG